MIKIRFHKFKLASQAECEQSNVVNTATAIVWKNRYLAARHSKKDIRKKIYEYLL